MFKRIGVAACIESSPEAISAAAKLLLPGVGAFDAAMNRINATPGLRATLDRKVLDERVPILGVCLGMQLLTRASEEGNLPGLNWIPAETRRFPGGHGIKVPHMGWNLARPRTPSPLTADAGEDPRYYFVHSFYVKAEDPSYTLMTTEHGIDFDSAIGRENVFGVQFHPEKSHRFGMQILANFAEM
jgi:glutamine amidotransferase